MLYLRQTFSTWSEPSHNSLIINQPLSYRGQQKERSSTVTCMVRMDVEITGIWMDHEGLVHRVGSSNAGRLGELPTSIRW